MKLKKAVAVIVFLTLMLQPFTISKVEGATLASTSDYVFRVLEIQPDRTFELSGIKSSKVLVDQYSVSEYIALRDDIIGKYDVIYIGNKGSYRYFGQEMTSRLAHAALQVNNTGAQQGLLSPDNIPQYEYKPAIDITNLKATAIKSFINTGGLVVLPNDLYSSSTTNDFKKTKLYKNFSVYKTTPKNNVVFSTNPINKVTDLVSNTTKFMAGNGKLRPSFDLKSSPKQFDGTSSTYISSGVINFIYDLKSYTSSNATYTITLYFDIDGDGYYETNEIVNDRKNVSANDNLQTSVTIPVGFIGLQPWKLIVTDEATSVSNYKLGQSTFVSGNPFEVNILQIYPNNNTFDLKNQLKGSDNKTLLDISESGYNIKVDTISISDFNNLYNSPSFTITDYKNANGKKYNMIIMGFSDTYGGSDIKSERIANDIKAYINTGQSMMFTHDTVTFRYMYGSKYGTSNFGNWSVNITKYFRDVVGQNVMVHETAPVTGSLVHGFTDYLQKRGDNIYSGWQTTNSVSVFNQGILTVFPYTLAKTLPVATTHTQWFQLDLEDPEVLVWYTLKGSNLNEYDPGSYYYTYSKGNVTYSGTGHTDLANSNNYEERKLFVNTMVKAIRGGNFAPIVQLDGLTSGDLISTEKKKQTISILAKDPDVNDRFLNGQVYVDKNGNGTYEESEIVKTYKTSNNTALVNGEAIDLEIDLSTMASTVDNLRIKIVVYDGPTYGQGAKGEVETVNPRKKVPVLESSLVVTNMLVGETQTVNLGLGLSTITSDMSGKIETIKLKQTVAKKVSGVETLLPLSSTDLAVWSVAGLDSVTDKLYKDLTDTLQITTGLTFNQSYAFKIQAKNSGSFVLNSNLSYKYTLGALATTIPSDKTHSMEVYKGSINMMLTEDTGASVSKPIKAKIYRVKDKLGNALATKETTADITIPANSPYVYGDDPSEIVVSGYYVIETEAIDGYEAFTSAPFLIEPTSTGHYKDVNMVLQSKPVKNVSLKHLDPVNAKLMTRHMKQNDAANWQLSFDLSKKEKSVAFTLIKEVPSGESPLNLAMIKVLNSAGTDVTSKFKFIDGVITAEDLTNGIDPDTYRVFMTSKLPVNLPDHGDVYRITVDNSIRVVAMNDYTSDYITVIKDTLKFTFISDLLDKIL